MDEEWTGGAIVGSAGEDARAGAAEAPGKAKAGGAKTGAAGARSRTAKRAPAKRASTARRRGRRAARVIVRWSREREESFLETLAATPNVAEAARASGLSERSVYRRRQADADFRAKWLAALRDGYAKLEARLLDRALHGVEKPVYFGGHQVGTIVEHNDRIGLALLTMHRETVNGIKALAADEPVEELRARLKAELSEMNRRMGGAG